jgi:hypothetical protein
MNPARIPRVLRALRLAALSGAAALATGCFVFDELDAGRRKMDGPAAASNPAAGRGEDTEPSRPSGGPSTWWQNARSLSSEAMSADVTRCELPGGSQFMRADDCRARGGRVR